MADGQDYSGMWRCTYWYPSNERPGEQDSTEYYCQARQEGNKLALESLPNRPDHLVVNVTVDHSLATGNWVENTSPEGEFEGMEYSGALQLLISEDGVHMDGAWVGVGREKQDDGTFKPGIFTGKWSMQRAGQTNQA